MADTIKVPAVGPVKKGWVYGGVAILVLILGVAYYRHSKNAKTTTAAAPGTAAFDAGFLNQGDQFPPDGTFGDPTDPNSTDPATGITYGDERAGLGGAAPSGGGGGGTPAQGGSFASNAQWDQAAQAYLAGIGSDPVTVATALGRYLHGDALTPAQQTIVESAIGAEGIPPAAGTGGFPPSIRAQAAHAPAPKPKPKPKPKPEKVRVPDVAGQQYAAAARAIGKAGLRARGVPRAAGIVVSEAPRAGAEVDKGSVVALHVAATG